LLTFFKSTLNVKTLTLFTRQLATLLTAGLTVEDALNALIEQYHQPKIKSLMLSIRSKIREGYSLSNALSVQADNFSPLFIATVAAGEKTGHLSSVLLRLSDYVERQWKTQQRLTMALVYPLTVLVVAIGVVSFLLTFVVPKMIGVYANLHQSLPWPTQVLISVSNFIKHFGLWVISIGLLLIGLFYFYYQCYVKFRQYLHKFILRLPGLGNAVKTILTARFARSFAMLKAAGLPILEAINISNQLINNICLRNALDDAAKKIKEGLAIHVALKQTGGFSPICLHMLMVGEASGQLEAMLEHVAQNQENDIIRLIELGLQLFEPLVILIMGFIVLFIVLAILLPIFDLNQFIA
jgi:general secretion pathway protein F